MAPKTQQDLCRSARRWPASGNRALRAAMRIGFRVLASYYMLDVADDARALEIAARLPWASVGAVELWPVMHEAAGSV